MEAAQSDEEMMDEPLECPPMEVVPAGNDAMEKAPPVEAEEPVEEPVEEVDNGEAASEADGEADSEEAAPANGEEAAAPAEAEGEEAAAPAEAEGEEQAEPAVADEDDEPPPQKPRRALTAWACFLAAKYNSAISKKASEDWKALGDEDRLEYTEAAVAHKERYETEKTAYAAAHEAWANAHPVAYAALSSKSSSADWALDATVPYLPLSKVRKLTRLVGAKACSREGLFVLVKASEQLVCMLSEQTALTARKGKRKAVGQHDLASVLYGARCADLMSFCHADLPQAELLAAPQPKAPRQLKPRVLKAPSTERVAKKARRAEADGYDDVEEEEEDAEADAGKTRKRGKKGVENEPVQSTTMKSFFTARPVGEPAPAPPADAAFKQRADDDDDDDGADDEDLYQDDDDEEEEEEEEDVDESMAVQAAPARRRRAVLDDDDEEEDEAEAEAEDDGEDEEAGVDAADDDEEEEAEPELAALDAEPDEM